MIRGGHVDVRVLGAYQRSAEGDLANWHTDDAAGVRAVGGATDLATGVRDVFVMTTLFAADGSSKLVRTCSYLLTGVRCVSRVYTDCAVFLIDDGRVHVRETHGISLSELASRLRAEGVEL
jgi:3-oxoadipate CoA-transferase beta subunit